MISLFITKKHNKMVFLLWIVNQTKCSFKIKDIIEAHLMTYLKQKVINYRLVFKLLFQGFDTFYLEVFNVVFHWFRTKVIVFVFVYQMLLT